jgi:hypothetical protein
MALVTAYQLPFSMRAPARGELAASEAHLLRMQLGGPVTPEAIEAHGGTVTAWCVLAATGAMCGAAIESRLSGVDDFSRPMATPLGLEWSLVGVRLDDRAAIVLAHMMLPDWESHPFVRLELLPVRDPNLAQPVHSDPDAWDIYPELDRSIRFRHHLASSVMGSGRAVIRFGAPPDPAQQAAIQNELLTWAAMTSLGAYAIAPGDPRACGMAPETDLQFVGEELDWPLPRFRAHAGAVVGLANVVSAIDREVVPVVELLIE